MSTQNKRPACEKRLSQVKQIEQALDTVYDGIARELDTTGPAERDAATYRRLADLHRAESDCWKRYLTIAKTRLTWLAASAAADRANQLATNYRASAAAMDGTCAPVVRGPLTTGRAA